jgi:hypothetical protein
MVTTIRISNQKCVNKDVIFSYHCNQENFTELLAKLMNILNYWIRLSPSPVFFNTEVCSTYIIRVAKFEALRILMLERIMSYTATLNFCHEIIMVIFYRKKIINGQNYQAVSKLCLSTDWQYWTWNWNVIHLFINFFTVFLTTLIF